MNNVKKFLMEFVGTFFFILTIAVTGNPLAIACMLMAWVYIGGYISGGHYNPAVSLAVALRGRLSWDLAIGYMISQVLGGFAAYSVAAWILGQISIPRPALGVTFTQAFVVEVLLTFVLALVVLTVATYYKFKPNHVFGFAIGFTIPALAILGSPLSGGLFNPAIALGSMLVGMFKGIPVVWSDAVMYVGGALLGGALAAIAFKYFMQDHDYEYETDVDHVHITTHVQERHTKL